jgi:hypothetical protein
MNCERTDTHPARAGRLGGKSIRRAGNCTRRKAVAIELEVVPFDPKVVALALEVMSFGRAAVANARMTALLALVRSRSCTRAMRSIGRKHHPRFYPARTELADVAIVSHGGANAPAELAILSRGAAIRCPVRESLHGRIRPHQRCSRTRRRSSIQPAGHRTRTRGGRDRIRGPRDRIWGPHDRIRGPRARIIGSAARSACPSVRPPGRPHCSRLKTPVDSGGRVDGKVAASGM